MWFGLVTLLGWFGLPYWVGLFWFGLVTLLGWWLKVCKGKRARPCPARSSFVLPEVIQ